MLRRACLAAGLLTMAASVFSSGDNFPDVCLFPPQCPIQIGNAAISTDKHIQTRPACFKYCLHAGDYITKG